MKKNSMKKTIIIRDYRWYESGKSCDGGCYAYYITLTPVEGGVLIRHETSADFEYCSVYGEFRHCDDCHYWQDEQCTSTDDIISEKEAKRLLRSYYKLAQEGEDIVIEYEE